MGCSSTHIFQPQALRDSSFEGDLQHTHGPSAWVSQETEENLKIKQEINTEQGRSSLSTPGEMVLCSSPAKWEKKKKQGKAGEKEFNSVQKWFKLSGG